ncbi:MAG: hypothetical protein KAH21_11170, partial [Spirochaetaceae bacterium]|nr:hypothetical protein [Spirochaetaceae bacterium]
MSPTLTAPRWRIDGNVTDDGNDTAFMAAWPRRIHQDFSDDLSAPSALPPPSRRMMPEVPDDPEKPAPAEGRVKDKKKPEHPSSSNPQGAPKNKPVPKPPLPPTPIPKSKPPAAPPVKKNKPIPEPVDSSPGNPYVPTPPKVKDIEPEPEPEPSGIDDPPPLPPVIDTGSIPPESDGEGEPDSPIEAASPKPAENEVKDSPIADIGDDNSDPLTGEAANDVIGEHPHTNAIQNLFSKAGDYFKDLIGGIFPRKTEVPSSDSFSHSYVPVALPPPRNPAVELDPVGS